MNMRKLNVLQMQSIFLNYLSLFNENSIKISNKYLDIIFKNFQFHYFSKENQDKIIISKIDEIIKIHQEVDYKNIFILEYIEQKHKLQFNSDFFFLCFHNNILIIEKTEIKQFYNFLTRDKEVKIYSLSEDIIIINQTDNLQLQIINEIDNKILSQEIQSFSSNFTVIFKNKDIYNLFNLIVKTISGFLIEKSYHKTIEYDRVLHSKDFQEKNKEKIIESDNYIKLLDLTINAQLIYYIELEELFILKIFLDEEADKLFERERNNFLKIVHHPFFPKYLGISRYFNYNCIVVEYIHGHTLDKINEMDLNKEIKIKIIFQIIIALDYLNCHDYIYRDLKTDNVIINDKGSIVIIDFDRMLNKADNQLTHDFQSIFIAPEIKSVDHFSTKSDVYSIGKIIGDIFQKEFSNEISPEYSDLYDIYMKCIETDDSQRPDISDLVFIFYDIFFSTKVGINDNEIIQSIIDNNNQNYFDFWFFISEYEHQLSKKKLKIQNNTNYWYKLGLMYLSSKDTPRDIDKSVYYFTLAANQNHYKAQYHLGLLYSDCKYIKRDITKSIYYYTLSANQNYSKAQYNLGLIYYENELVPRDIDKSIYYLTLAANQNVPEAQFNLGLIYEIGQYISRDFNKMIHYFTLAADQYFVQAQYRLGLLYSKSEYIPKNINKSIYYLTLAANQNYSRAQYSLRLLYIDAVDIPRDINKSIYYLTLAANQNMSKASLYLGILYINEKYIPRDIEKSIYYFTLAADQNNSQAQFYLGLIYETNQYTKQDINKSIYYYSLSANQNNSDSQYKLGLLYFFGQWIARDINKSIHYFTLAANQNHSEAQFNLGSLYLNNKFVLRDIDKSIYYFTLSANQNNVNAQYNLGLLYIDDEYVQQDINKSIYYLTLAANQNDSSAQFNLGSIYEKYTSNPQNINKSIYYYTLAANQKHIKAQYNLGLIYYNGKIVKRDINKSIHYFTLVANQNDPKSHHALGVIYESGQYVPRDIEKSIYYYKLSANQNNKAAQYNLGYLYSENLYVPRDINKSLYYYKLAADQNDPYALCNLGSLYYNGNYIPQDINKAIHYFTLAANLNDSIAQFALGLISEKSDCTPQNIEKIIHYYTLSASQNNESSLMKLGLFYYKGKYVSRDLDKSIHYFEIAAKNNCYEASYCLGCIFCKGSGSCKNIDKIINYFKESSSFSHQYSKNNLGLLYKNIKHNEIAIEYFKEAIQQKNDKVSMYNLGSIYFYGKFGKEDIDKSINLFIQSINQSFHPSKVILCLAIIKKVTTIDFENISKELEQFGIKSTKFHQSIYSFIIKHRLKNKINYSKIYKEYENIEYFYDMFTNIINYSDFINDNEESKLDVKNPRNKQQNITEEFYEGFKL